jgi:AraC-like DNA-binding protein
MNTEIIQQLLQKTYPRDWQKLQKSFHAEIIGHFGKEPIYKFFETLGDNLEINSNTISISVQPIDSYVPFHIHNYVEIITPIKGSCVLQTTHENIPIMQDDIAVVGKNTPHTTKVVPQGTLVVSIALKLFAFSFDDLQFMLHSSNGQSLSHLMFTVLSEEHGEGQFSVFKIHHQKKIVQLIQDILSEYYEEDIQSSQIIRFSILTLFSRLIRHVHYSNHDVTTRKHPENPFMSLLLYIEQHYSDITLEKLASHFGYHPNYLSSYLKKQTGMTFIKLVHLQRINVAAEYLKYTTLTIDKISIKIGYENPSYFYKVFKKIMHESPREYRQQHQVFLT